MSLVETERRGGTVVLRYANPPLGTMTAAGGALPSPGTREPYEHSPSHFYSYGTFLGHSIRGIYDYVVPIDFNREPGTPPTNPVEPDGTT